jgi:outer membrane protein TolC
LYYKVVDANIFSNAVRDLSTTEPESYAVEGQRVIMLIQLYKALGGGWQL